MPEHLRHIPGQTLQFTLVDCPGHASLIRTIIGGAQIIDMMILVVDVTKGIQVRLPAYCCKSCCDIVWYGLEEDNLRRGQQWAK